MERHLPAPPPPVPLARFESQGRPDLKMRRLRPWLWFDPPCWRWWLSSLLLQAVQHLALAAHVLLPRLAGGPGAAA